MPAAQDRQHRLASIPVAKLQRRRISLLNDEAGRAQAGRGQSIRRMAVREKPKPEFLAIDLGRPDEQPPALTFAGLFGPAPAYRECPHDRPGQASLLFAEIARRRAGRARQRGDSSQYKAYFCSK
jgi:uncharacterized small protein (DUF1192 family)